MRKQRHPTCRPPRDADGALPKKDKHVRLGFNSQWRLDNGTPGLAFITVLTKKQVKVGDSATVYVPDCNCKSYARCPASKALNDACDQYGGASLVRVASYEQMKRAYVKARPRK